MQYTASVIANISLCANCINAWTQSPVTQAQIKRDPVCVHLSVSVAHLRRRRLALTASTWVNTGQRGTGTGLVAWFCT